MWADLRSSCHDCDGPGPFAPPPPSSTPLKSNPRPSVEAACEMGGVCEHSRATEHVGEVGRMWARHASQSHGSHSDPSRHRLDLSHSINGVNQVRAPSVLQAL